MNRNVAAAVAISMSMTVLALDAVAKDAKGGAAALVPAGELKWSDVQGFPGLKMAVVDGDPGKGASHFMMKFPGGFASPLHHHTPDHYVSVISGTMVLNVDGKDQKLPAGSYFSFKGKKPHITKCEAGADCVLSIDARGKWDVIPEDKAPEKKK